MRRNLSILTIVFLSQLIIAQENENTDQNLSHFNIAEADA